MRSIFRNIFFGLIIGLIASSCGNNDNKQAATYGKLVFESEKSLQYIMESEASVFEYHYPDADITAEFKEETKVIEDFINNKTTLIVAYRDFTAEEKKFLFDRQVVPYSTVIGLEGVALIVPTDSKDTAITVPQLITLLTGEGDSLEQLKAKWSEVVFDGAGSANARYVDSLIQRQKLAPYCFTKNSPQETIDYVATHKNAIGIVSFAMLADKDDKRVKETRKKVRTVALSEDGEKYFRPAQASFFNFDYPLIRKIYMHSRDYDGSLAMGFISFVSSQEGQLVIKQGGLMPARMEWTDMNAVFEPMNIK